MTVKLTTEHHLEVLSLNGGCTGSSEPIHFKMQSKCNIVGNLMSRLIYVSEALWFYTDSEAGYSHLIQV